MTTYVLQRTSKGGGFVAPPGSRKSYTHDLLKAQAFTSKAQAEREACENEIPVSVDSLLQRP